MRRLARRAAVLASFLLAANIAVADDAPRVIAVNYALQYLAERLLDDTAEVVYPVPEGTDPSFWRPSVSDISAVQSADLILLNGAGFATWTARVSLPRSRIVDTSRGLEDRFITTSSITHSHGDGGEHSHEGTASYLWLDPMLALAQAEAVADALTTRGLVDAATVKARMVALSDDLQALDAEARDLLAAAADTPIIATHPRYQYLAQAYGLTILSLEWGAGAMPDANELAQLDALVLESGAAVVIWEADPPPEARQAIADRGLEDLVFPTFAVPPRGTDFLAGYRAALEALRSAMDRAKS